MTGGSKQQCLAHHLLGVAGSRCSRYFLMLPGWNKLERKGRFFFFPPNISLFPSPALYCKSDASFIHLQLLQTTRCLSYFSAFFFFCPIHLTSNAQRCTQVSQSQRLEKTTVLTVWAFGFARRCWEACCHGDWLGAHGPCRACEPAEVRRQQPNNASPLLQVCGKALVIPSSHTTSSQLDCRKGPRLCFTLLPV